jgi:hypothetical protein
MDPYFKAAIAGAATENIRMYATDATLNGKTVQVIPETEAESFPIGDGGMIETQTMGVIISTAQWVKHKTTRASSNVMVLGGTTFRVLPVQVLPNFPTVKLTLEKPNS